MHAISEQINRRIQAAMTGARAYDDAAERAWATPLLKLLKPGCWMHEDELYSGNGLTIVGARIFFAKGLRLIEYRRRWFRNGFWLRLTPKGERERNFALLRDPHSHARPRRPRQDGKPIAV